MESNSELKWIIVAIAFVVAGAIIIPILIKKGTNKAYKRGSKVTEDDFVNNGPEIVKKSEESANDD